MATKPAIVAASDDASVLRNVARELRRRYSHDYTVVAGTTKAARRAIADDIPIALVIASFTPEGVDVLGGVRRGHTHTKRALLVDWSEHRDRRAELVDVIASGRADYFITEPLATPDEGFHRAVVEFLDEWWHLHGLPFAAVTVVGDDRSARVHELCDLLQRHDFPYRFHDTDSAEAAALLAASGLAGERGIVMKLRNGRTLVDPTNIQAAEALGARTEPGPGVYDVAVVGAGPAGLSVAVYAGSEGLRVTVIEGIALGGQAGTSSMIRNYLGFPRGISGAELAARAADQALIFGAETVYGHAAVGLDASGAPHAVRLAGGGVVPARAIVIATGVSYRTLEVPSLEPYHGIGVHYGAATAEAHALVGKPVYVVGGGNSAGQAAMYLSNFASHVTIVVRSGTLARSMSDYLVKALAARPNVEVCFDTEVVDGGGDERLRWVALRDRKTGEVSQREVAALFVLIGAAPHTEWLPPEVARDEWGYVRSGTRHEDASLDFETTVPGVYAVGDVRRGSVKRVASAAGEGAICVRLIHDRLDRLAEQRA